MLTLSPGGFVREDESLEDGVIRELREDTRIKVPEAVLRGSIRSTDVFDYPKRSARGRTIAHAHLIQLRDSTSLPQVRGSEQRPVAFWLPFHQLDPQRMFEDHYHIIRAFDEILRSLVLPGDPSDELLAFFVLPFDLTVVSAPARTSTRAIA